MAKSRFEYVKQFELSDALLPHCWIVVRIDGRAFTKFAQAHGFEKPNDERALRLMNASAQAVMDDCSDACFAYGESDEYSFVIRKSSTLYQRRSSKLISVLSTLFVAAFVMRWRDFFPATRLLYPPAFDARAVCYPSDAVLRDYLSWRQVDCHVNNQYNTCFWALVKNGCTPSEAQARIKGTNVAMKNELLWNEAGCNYDRLPPIFRKGSCLYRQEVEEVAGTTEGGQPVQRRRSRVVISHEDIVGDGFWQRNSHILAS